MPALACRLVSERAFPVIFAIRVTATAEFYQRLGFTKHFQLPPDGEPGYVGLRRGSYEVAVVMRLGRPISTAAGSGLAHGSRCSYMSMRSMRPLTTYASTRRCCENPQTCHGASGLPMLPTQTGTPSRWRLPRHLHSANECQKPRPVARRVSSATTADGSVRSSISDLSLRAAMEYHVSSRTRRVIDSTETWSGSSVIPAPRRATCSALANCPRRARQAGRPPAHPWDSAPITVPAPAWQTTALHRGSCNA
jgi:hypothetical protein